MKEKGSTPITIDLKPNRSLINPKFDGYKLSLEPLPLYSSKLEPGTEIERCLRSEEQYSVHHIKLFTIHNFAVVDTWSEQNSIYYVDKDWNLRKVSVDGENCKILSNNSVWSIPKPTPVPTGRFNITFNFPNQNYCTLTDGCGTIYILETGNRDSDSSSDCTWKSIYSEVIEAEKPIFLIDSISSLQNEMSDNDNIDLLLLQINDKVELNEFILKRREKFGSKPSTPFVNTLTWITISKDKNTDWSNKCKRIIIGHGEITYAFLDKDGSGLNIATDSPYYYYFDSLKPIVDTTSSDSAEVNMVEEENKEIDKKPDYVWYQKSKEIILMFRLPETGEIKKEEILVDTTENTIKVEFRGKLLLVGDLWKPIKAEETTWNFSSGTSGGLEIILQTVDSLQVWQKFVENDENGRQIVDNKLVAEIHSKLSSLCAEKWDDDSETLNEVNNIMDEYEYCDEYPNDTFRFIRFDSNSQNITHQVDLANHQWLFHFKTNENENLFCIRHDVDGIVYKPEKFNRELANASGDNDSKEWGFKHVATFQALGYVQASKNERKYTASPPDFSYVAIFESMKHVYIYRQPDEIEGDLRNRKTGQRVQHVSRQQIISFNPPSEILGVACFNEFILILNSSDIQIIRIKPAVDI